MLLEHKAPFLDDVEQRLSERTRVNTKPILEDDASLYCLHVLIDRLVRIDLRPSDVRSHVQIVATQLIGPVFMGLEP